MSYQQIIIQGNVGKDCDVRYAPSGKAVTSFSVAVSEKRSGKEETEWFNCVAFDKTAEVAGQYVSKGSQIMVVGRMKTEKYEKDGQTRYSTKVMVDRLVLLGKGEPRASFAEPPSQASGPNEEDLADVPF